MNPSRSEPHSAAIAFHRHDGELVALADLEAEAREPGQYSRANPLRLRISPYNSTAYHRKPQRLSEEGVAVVAADFKDRPVLDGVHAVQGGVATIGRVERGIADGPQMQLDVAMWGAAAVSDVLDGIRQGWSISWGRDADTRMTCSECGEPALALDSKCSHLYGFDGSELVYSGGEAIEVTRTYAPSVVGTRVDAVYHYQDEGLELVVQAAAERLRRRAELAAHQNGADSMPLPLELKATAGPGAAEITLEWEPDPTAASYRVYRADAAGVERSDAPRAEVSEPTFVDGELEVAREYHYAVTFIDSEGVESEVSEEVAARPDGGPVEVEDEEDEADEEATDEEAIDPPPAPPGPASVDAQAAAASLGATGGEVVTLRHELVSLRAEVASMRGAEMRRTREAAVQSFRENGRIQGDFGELVALSASDGAPSVVWLNAWMERVPGNSAVVPNLALTQELQGFERPGSVPGPTAVVVHGIDVSSFKTFEELHVAAQRVANTSDLEYAAVHREMYRAFEQSRRAPGSRH